MVRTLVLLQIKPIHARSADFVVWRTASNDFPLVIIIELEIEIAKPCLPIEPGSYISQEGGERSHVQSTTELLGPCRCSNEQNVGR